MTKEMSAKAIRLIEENIHGIRYAIQPDTIKQSLAARLIKASEVAEYKRWSLEKIEVYTAVVEHLKSLTDPPSWCGDH